MQMICHVNSSRTGHDKLVRLLQYTCKLLVNWSNDASGLHHLESTLGSARKLLRFGTFFESLEAAGKALNHRDPVIRMSTALSKLCNAVFLFTDHLIWLNSVRMVNLSRSKWSKISINAWFYSVLFSLVCDLYKLKSIVEEYSRNCRNISLPSLSFQGVLEAYDPLCGFLISSQRPLLINLIKNCFDIVLPLSTLGYVKSSSLSGLCGIISTSLSILPLLPAK
ncbi:peroxisomal membrane protein 11A [Eurytemora carolleeae]|uniref:peroxisomal membrane protein 11A n=1 Tax=Eurytemora carolleeae TaxID=1294199 RepID=UPI000C75EE3E|nr:peroxisomal membrane protein 11A [Eurytemora carolleeae]|eukprot:XP_023341656.1 peroxisomal membrane protein 11A-like [Eurytemora affinis]